MVKPSMDLLELLRKRGMDGDVDFLREALRVLVDGIMDAEVSAQIGSERDERSSERVTCPASTIFADLASISFVGAPPRHGPAVGLHQSGNWAHCLIKTVT